MKDSSRRATWSVRPATAVNCFRQFASARPVSPFRPAYRRVSQTFFIHFFSQIEWLTCWLTGSSTMQVTRHAGKFAVLPVRCVWPDRPNLLNAKLLTKWFSFVEKNYSLFFFCVLYPRVNEILNTHRVPVRNFPKYDNWVKVTFPPRKWRKESGDGAGNCSRALLVNDSLSASFGTARALGFRAGNRLRALTELLYRGENDPTIKNRRTMIGYVTTFSFSKTWISPMYVKKQMNKKIRKCKI